MMDMAWMPGRNCAHADSFPVGRPPEDPAEDMSSREDGHWARLISRAVCVSILTKPERNWARVLTRVVCVSGLCRAHAIRNWKKCVSRMRVFVRAYISREARHHFLMINWDPDEILGC